ncbi:MAG TPA: hypothetical protein VGM10_34750 [Actinocrinis sp.]|jgi:opacity protein-like surface antigen
MQQTPWIRALRRRAPIAAAAAAALAAVAMAAPAQAASSSPLRPQASTGIAGWTNTTHYLESTLSAGEGVATVDPPGGTPYELYRGVASIPVALAAAGWTHVGDPDSVGGYIFDDYQNSSSSVSTKLYMVTTPSGTVYQYTHTLVSGELYNNSFVAISPDTQWMISGEWGTMSHIQIYPTPLLNPATSPTGGALGLSGYIQLDHQVNDIQGCDFVTATELVCASDDSSETLFTNAKPLLEVQLSAPLGNGSVTGHVVDLGSIPQANSICSGTFEAEGVDYDTDTGVLRVEIIQPSICEVATTVYEYVES